MEVTRACLRLKLYKSKYNRKNSLFYFQITTKHYTNTATLIFCAEYDVIS